MMKCIFPGTFDPLTNGHIDIITRARKLFDEVVVLILINHKKSTLFSLENRIKFAQKALKNFEGVYVDSFDGLLVEYCDNVNCHNVVRGVRNGVDFEYEMQYFGINHILSEKIEMFFLPTKKRNLYISSSNVRELIAHRKDVSGLVPDEVNEEIKKLML
jgi:pantetheine-phosphate adenylyltransferase